MILVIAVGQKQPDWINTAFEDYASRISTNQKVALKEIKAEPRTSGKTVKAIKAAEAKRILAVLHAKENFKSNYISVALDERGDSLNTNEFAKFLTDMSIQRSNIVFIIGGPDGLDHDLKQQCSHQIQLSNLTLPHGLVRVILIEQIYRTISLASNHPYHRA